MKDRRGMVQTRRIVLAFGVLFLVFAMGAGASISGASGSMTGDSRPSSTARRSIKLPIDPRTGRPSGDTASGTS